MKFDEFTIGQIFETKSFSVTQEDIKRFSGEFDPQYMHFDEDKAARSMFKGIIASGIHTLSLSFKHWIELGIYGDDMIAGTGMDRIKFRKPVYPGDKLHTVVEVIDKCNRQVELNSFSQLILNSFPQLRFNTCFLK